MCLAIPGQILSIRDAAEPNADAQANDPSLYRMGRVSFGGIIKEVSLAYVPHARVGDYVIVHVGFALNTVDEAEARKVFDYLREMDAAGLHEALNP
jgi:hydrogenase expression/formation protein HypC